MKPVERKGIALAAALFRTYRFCHQDSFARVFSIVPLFVARTPSAPPGFWQDSVRNNCRGWRSSSLR